MSGPEAFAIVATFQNWRLDMTTKEHPEYASIDINTLNAADFLELSTFDPDTQIDIVKQRAEQYFVDLIIYFLSDAGLKALGATKPSLNADLLALIQNADITEFFKEYAPLWLLQSIYHHNKGAYRSEIKGGEVENCMFVLNRSNIFIRITMMLYHLALKQLVPALLPYVYFSDINLFQTKVRNYFKDHNNVKKWLTRAIKCQYNNVPTNPDFFDSYRFNELKTKLDLLQPNNRLSNDLMSMLWYSLLSYYTIKNLVNQPVNRNIIIKTNQLIVNRIITTPTNQFNTILNTTATALNCTKPDLVDKFSDLMCLASLEIPINQVLPNETDFQLWAKPFNKELLATTPFAPLQDNKDFIKFSNAVFCGCHVGVLAYGILNGENDENVADYDPSLVYVGEGLFINRYLENMEQGRLFPTMAEFLRNLTNDMAKDATDVFSAYKNFVPRFIHPNTRELIMRLIPAFYILTRDQQAYQLFVSNSSVILDWGDLNINLHNMDDSEVDNCIPGLFTVLKKAGCAASSTALMLGGGLYGLSLSARVYPQLDMTMKLYEIAIDGQEDIIDIPDYIDEFINSVEPNLRIDYDNVQIDHSNWESYYESLDPRIQKGLDILMEIENDNLNEMFKLLGELEKRATEKEFNKVTTQIVKLPTHINTVTAGDFTALAGSQTTITITRPSKLISIVQYFSNVVQNTTGYFSIDVTPALNGQIMTNGGNNTYPWPVGTSISHSRDWTAGCSVTQETVQPGVYQYDIRSRIRGGAATGLVDAPAATLFIVPI